MMAQYRRIKGELPRDALLLFRLGDFYEMFFEDAKAGAPLLNVALTKRGDVPMCGIPFHAAHGYIARLLKAGRKVALCDQVEEARPGQLVKREVTQILSPGAHFDERLLAPERNNFIAALCACGKVFGLAAADLTTGDFTATELEGEAAARAELERLRPAEIIFPAASETLAALARGHAAVLNPYEDWLFAPETAQFTVREHFKVASLDGFGLKDRPAAVGAAGAVIHYLTQHLRRDVSALTRLSFYQCSDFMGLDSVSLRNLEVLEPRPADAPRQASLYGALNRTVTPMGARRLRDWLSQPLGTATPILRRRDAVRLWLENGALLDEFRRELAEVRDLERTLGRLTAGSGNGRDLLALRRGLEKIPVLKQILARLQPPGAAPELAVVHEDAPRRPDLMDELAGQLAEAPDLIELIARAIVEEPPLAVKEGGLIRDGFDSALDELRHATRDGKDWIAQLQRDEIARTGIASLKVRFNSVFGYYIEVTKSNLEKVPVALYPQADHRRGRAVHHAGAEGEGVRRFSGRRSGACGWSMSCSSACGKRCWASCRACNKRRRPWRRWTCWRRSPRRRGCTIIASRKSRRTARSKFARGAIRCWSKTWAGNGLCPTTPTWTTRGSS